MVPLPRLIRWLSRLTRLGFPVGDALRGPLSEEMAARLARGDSLADVLPPGPERGMVDAALRSARPVELLERLGETLEAADKLRRQVARALLYPRLLAVLVALEAVLLMGLVAPLELSSAAHGRPDLVEAVARWQWLLRGGGLLVLVVLVAPLVQPEILWGLARRFGVGPGPVEWLADQALWCRSLAQLVDAGRPLPDSLAIAARLPRGRARRAAAARLAEAVSRGDTLPKALEGASFEPLVGWAVEAGELGPALRDAASTLELEVELRIEMQLRLLEPLALLLLAPPVLLLGLSFWVTHYNYVTPGMGNPQG